VCVCVCMLECVSVHVCTCVGVCSDHSIITGGNQLDDMELTGQEDINLLHTVVNTLPLIAAYKEGTPCWQWFIRVYIVLAGQW